MMLPFMLALALQRTTPQDTPPVVPGRGAVADTLPRYRGSTVIIAGDTVWFVPTLTADRAATVPVIGFARSSGEWISGTRPRHALVERAPRSSVSLDDGGFLLHVPGQLQWRGYADTVPLAYGYALTDTTPQPDPRSGVDSMARVALVRGRTPVDEVRIRVSGAERRQAFVDAGNRLGASDVPPPFTTIVSRWTAREGLIAIAFDAPAAPEEMDEADTGMERDEPQSWTRYLTGIQLLDTTTKRSRSLVHPGMIESRFGGLEIARGALFALALYAGPDTNQAFVHLLRYDLGSRRWDDWPDHRLPLIGAEVMRGDGTRLYVAAMDGVGVLDASTLQWQTRYTRDSTIVVAGRDSDVTIVSRERGKPGTPPVALHYPEANDSSDGLDEIANELHVRRRAAFKRALLARYSTDTLLFVLEEMIGLKTSRSYEDGPYGGAATADPLGEMLGHPEFVPFLLEMARDDYTHPFAIEVLRGMGDSLVLRSFRDAMEHGMLYTAIEAADSLHARGDSSAVRWYRAQLSNPYFYEIEERLPLGLSLRPLDVAVMRLGEWGDTTFVPRALQLLASPMGHTDALLPLYMLHGLLGHPNAGVRRATVAQLEASPRQWLVFLNAVDSTLGTDTIVSGAEQRIAERLMRAASAYSDTIGSAYPPEGRAQTSRSNLLLRAIGLVTIRPREAVSAYIETLDLDPDLAYAKQYNLIVLTGFIDVPVINDAADAARAAALWRGWWATHREAFVPVSNAEGNAALKRWFARVSPPTPTRP